MDINTSRLKKNAFRVTKERGKTAVRIRVPGGYIKAEYLLALNEVAEKYGDGSLHITSRQGFEIPNIPMEKIPEVNKALQSVIDGLEINQEAIGTGYSAAGTRNVSACIGNNVCMFANYNTTNFAKKIEKAIFPNDYHVKVALTGCPNDCIKTRTQDYGIIGMTEPQYDSYRCIGCRSCVDNCKKRSVGALSFENHKVVRNEEKCIGCGECVLKCPTTTWTRSEEKYYKLVIMGRSGKKNPRMGKDFINWIDEDSIIKIILNTYEFVDEHILKDAPGGKEHVGYIIDRTGFKEFKDCILKDVELGPKAIVEDNIYW